MDLKERVDDSQMKITVLLLLKSYVNSSSIVIELGIVTDNTIP